MTGNGSRAGSTGEEPLGTARDEAARLVEALAEWAAGALGQPGSAFSSVRDTLGADSVANGSAACRVCPVCHGIALLRGLRPEVTEHLLDAGGSLLAALRAGLEGPHGHDHGHTHGHPGQDDRRRQESARSRVEPIDIS